MITGGISTTNWTEIDEFFFHTQSDLVSLLKGSPSTIYFPRRTQPTIRLRISNMANTLTVSLPPKYLALKFNDPLKLKWTTRTSETKISAIAICYPKSYFRNSLTLGVQQQVVQGIGVYFNCTIQSGSSPKLGAGVSLGAYKKF